mgnify:CR=1 FL=1
MQIFNIYRLLHDGAPRIGPEYMHGLGANAKGTDISEGSLLVFMQKQLILI